MGMRFLGLTEKKGINAKDKVFKMSQNLTVVPDIKSEISPAGTPFYTPPDNQDSNVIETEPDLPFERS